jgi:putative phosphoesterase
MLLDLPMEKETKIAVIADIHGNSWALEAVLEFISKQNVNRIINLGDSLYGPLNPAKTFQLLSDHNITSISGNMDRYITEAWSGLPNAAVPLSHPTMKFVCSSLDIKANAWLTSQPGNMTIDDRIFLCHGTPESDETPLTEQIRQDGVGVRSTVEIEKLLAGIQTNITLTAHSHVPRFIRLNNKQWVINPGSVGLPCYTDDRPYPHRMSSYSPHAKFAIIDIHVEGPPKVEQISLVYDWNAAADAAKKNGRNDWAFDLLSGI